MENQTCYRTSLNSLNWSAIIAGAFVGLGLGFLLSVYSVAIGLSAYSSSANNAPVVAIGGVIGLFIGVIASMGVAGFVTGYLARFYHCYCHGGVIYGFITWSLALMLSALLVMPVTDYISSFESNLDPHATPVRISPTHTHANVTTTDDNQQKVVEAGPKHLAWSSWIMFGMFFVGGVSSCVGACWGMCCRKEENDLRAPL